MSEQEDHRLLPITAEVVAAYVRGNRVRPEELTRLVQDVGTTFATLEGLEGPAGAQEQPARKPAVPVSRSVTPDYIISLEDGRRFKSLKRHLMSAYGLTPEQYRARWNLPFDYPMVAPNYSAKRSSIGKQARREQLQKEKNRGRKKG